MSRIIVYLLLGPTAYRMISLSCLSFRGEYRPYLVVCLVVQLLSRVWLTLRLSSSTSLVLSGCVYYFMGNMGGLSFSMLLGRTYGFITRGRLAMYFSGFSTSLYYYLTVSCHCYYWAYVFINIILAIIYRVWVCKCPFPWVEFSNFASAFFTNNICTGYSILSCYIISSLINSSYWLTIVTYLFSLILFTILEFYHMCSNIPPRESGGTEATIGVLFWL